LVVEIKNLPDKFEMFSEKLLQVCLGWSSYIGMLHPAFRRLVSFCLHQRAVGFSERMEFTETQLIGD